MRKLNLILDYTKRAKQAQKDGYDFVGKEKLSEEVILTLEYPNGEPAAIFQTHPDPGLGREGAKTFMKYTPCNFIDKTREEKR